MELDILTLFPGMFTGPFQESIIKRAQEKDLVNIRVIDIRDFSSDKHRSVDDYPFGGGSGMEMCIRDSCNCGRGFSRKVGSYRLHPDQAGWRRPVSYTHLDVYKRQATG